MRIKHFCLACNAFLHGLQQGGIGILCWSYDAPRTEQTVGCIGVGTDEGYLALLLQREDAAVVLEEDERLGSKVACLLSVLWGEDVLCLLLVAHVAMLVRVFEEAETILCFEHTATGRVDVLLGEKAFTHSRFTVIQEGLRAHIHVGAGLEGFHAVLLLLAEAPRLHFVDAGIVCHDEALEAPFLPEHIVEEPGIGGGVESIDDVEAGHHTAHAGLDRCLVGREVLVEHTQMTHIYGVVVASCLGCAIEGVVLQASHDVLPLLEVALIATHQCRSHKASQVRVLACAFHDTTPSGVESYVNHGTIGPRYAVGRTFFCGDAGTFLDGRDVPRAGLSKWDGEDGPVAVDDIETDQEGNTQTALLHGHFLQGTHLVLSGKIEHGTEVAVHHEAAHLGVHCAAGRHFARGLEVELSNLFSECHLLHERADELIHLGIVGTTSTRRLCCHHAGNLTSDGLRHVGSRSGEQVFRRYL